MADLDRAALADALIADILTPYLLRSCPELIQSMGRESFACAQCLYREIGKVCARDDKARRTLELFEEDPKTYSSSFGLVLQRLLAQDESWTITIQQQVIAFTASIRGDYTVTKSGAIADSGGIAAGEMGVAVRGAIAGGIHIYGAQPPAPVKEMTEPERLQWQEQATYLAEAMHVYAAWLRSKAETTSKPPRAPYKNLFYYELSDESIFFGREQATQQLLDCIRGCEKARRLTVLHAPSGAGKTSLINAAITPALLRAGDVTLYALARIGTDYENPAAAIRKRILDAVPADRPQPDLSNLSLHDFLRLATAGLGGGQLVIFLDQFEEFFIHLSPEIRAPFINELAACYDDEALPVKFVISIRKDYFSDLSELEKTAIPTVFYNQSKLEPLTRSQATEAITKPVAPLGIHYTAELVETLLNDLETGGMELPHLQLICSRLYETRQGNAIALEDYEALGRAEGILGGYLASFMDQLGPLKPVAQDVLVEMVTSEDTKRVMSRAELGARVGEEGLDEVLTRLVAGRLLRREEEGGVIRYEMAHEYLIREITTWVDAETRARKQAEELLAREVQAWQQLGTLTGPDKLDIIATQREHIRFTPEAQELLLRSALANSHDLALWPGLVGDADLRKQILDEFTIEPRAAVRAHAAWTWSNLDEPASVPALMTLALEDSSPVVTAAASEGLLRLERQRDQALRELISISRSEDRARRGRALAILTRVPLESLEPDLRWRITMTRLRLALSHLYNRLLPRPYRRFVVVSVSILLLLLGVVYGFLAGSSYLDVVKGSASGYDGLIIVRRGHPSLQSFPGFDQTIVESDFGLGNVDSKEQEKLSKGQIVTFKWQKGDAGYELWAQEALTLFSPTSQAYYGWYLGDSPEIAVENLMADIRDKETHPGLALATLEQVIIAANDPAVTQQAISSLTPLLSDEEPNLRAAGIIGLSRVVTPETNRDLVIQVISRIAPYLDDDSVYVRATALEGLRHITATAHDPAMGRQVIDIVTESLGSGGVGSVDSSLLRLWIETIIALDDSSMIGYALDSVISLQGVMRPSEYGNMLNNLFYGLSELMIQADEKAIAAQTPAAIAPLMDSEDSSIFWPVMDLLLSAANVDAEAALQVVDVLSPSLETQDSEDFWYVVNVLSRAAFQTDDSAIARDVYESLIPLVNHDDREVRAAATWSLAPIAAITEAPDIVSGTFNTLIELSHNEDEDSDIRQAALYGIGCIVAEGSPELAESGMDILLKEINNPDRDIRERAIWSLGMAACNPRVTEKACETLKALTRDNLADNREAVGGALYSIIQTAGSPDIVRSAVSMIPILLTDPEPSVRILVSRDLLLASHYTADNPYYNPEVASALFVSLTPLLAHDNRDVNEIIVHMLENMVGDIDDTALADQAVAALLPFVDHKDAVVRQSVVRSLAVAAGKTDAPMVAGKVVAALLPLLEDEDNNIQISAADGLRQAVGVVNEPQVAADVSEALKPLLDDYNVRLSAFSASAHTRSWLDTQSLLIQLQNPLDKQERDIASRALFLAALRDPAQLTSMKGELESLRHAREPFVRIAATQTLEMLNIAALAHDAIEDSKSLSRVQSYLREMASGSSYYFSRYGPSGLRPSALGHIQFAVEEALTELHQFERAQSKTE